jgi:hypothetical protein
MVRFTMENVQIAQLWKRAKESDAPVWLSELIFEIKRLQARLEALEQGTGDARRASTVLSPAHRGAARYAALGESR